MFKKLSMEKWAEMVVLQHGNGTTIDDLIAMEDQDDHGQHLLAAMHRPESVTDPWERVFLHREQQAQAWRVLNADGSWDEKTVCW